MIEGVIGVGKTTLARMMQKELDAGLVLEVFEENPFLSDFYTDRARYAFQTQIFFLLSRYHQQRQLTHLARPLVSDYMFEKDRLFAQVNLDGDELETYYRVQEALAENITTPDLLVFLKADTETLMNRITARDRPYERNMEAAYIDRLRVAYERFFGEYTAAPVLIVDTNDLDIVRNPEDREEVFARIRGALGAGPSQPALPGLETGKQPPPAGMPAPSPEQTMRRLGDFQRFHRGHDSDIDPTLGFLQVQAALGELARMWVMDGKRIPTVPDLSMGLAEVLAATIRLANHAQVDLEAAYLAYMRAAAPTQGDQ